MYLFKHVGDRDKSLPLATIKTPREVERETSSNPLPTPPPLQVTSQPSTSHPPPNYT